MGDNLMDARNFVLACQQHIALLAAFGSEGQGRSDYKAALKSLGEIESRAKLMHARAIHRMVQIATNDMLRSENPSLNAQTLLGLDTLVVQYKCGLEEIETAQAVNTAQVENELSSPISKTVSKAKIKSAEISTSENKADTLTRLMRTHETAKQTLGEAIKLAQSQEKPALMRLMEFSLTEPSEGEGLSSAGAGANIGEIKTEVSFESIMPALTSEILRFARQQNKSVSISFAADPLPVNVEILEALEHALIALGQKLVSYAVDTPERRQFLGLSRSAHMALTVRENGGLLDVDVSCDGRAPNKLADDAVFSELRALGAQTQMSFDGSWLRFELLHVPVKMGAGPVIKPPRPLEAVNDSVSQNAERELAV